MAFFSNSNSNCTKTTFSKYLTIGHQDPNEKLSLKNPFKIAKALKDILGKKYVNDPKPLSSGLLLIEVDQKQTHDKLMSIKTLDKIPVTVKPHSTLNQTKGTIYCESLKETSDETIKKELLEQDIIDVYRVQKSDGSKTNLFILTFNNSTLPKEVGVRVQGRSRPCPLSVGLNSISLKPTLAHHPLSLDE